jgi:hypothetical protein
MAENKELEKIIEMYESIGLPRQEALNLALQQFEVGELGQAEELGASGMEALSADPEVLAQQKATLAKLAEVGEAGLTPEDIAERNELMRNIAGQEQSRQKAIAQEMAQRGISGSGVELATRLGSSQASAQRAAESAEALEAEKYRRALQGITQAGQYAGQLRGQEFGEGAAKASAADAIAKFNLQNRANIQAQNIARQRDVGDRNVQLQHQKELAEKQAAIQQPAQQFQQQMALTGAKAGAYQTQAQIDAQKEAAKAGAKAQEKSAGFGLLGNVIGAGAGLLASDENVKVNIEDGEEKIDEMLDNVEPKSYDYVDPKYGEGNHVGVMAQDLENSELGETFVEEDMEGVKRVDYQKMTPTILAAQTKQHEEMKDVKNKLAKLEEMLLKYRS